MQPLYLALGAMLAQQTFTSVGKTFVPVIAPVISDDLGVNPALVGVFMGIAAFASTVTTMGCGGLIMRYGALRVSQVSLLIMAVALAVGALGQIPMLALSAFALGAGTSLATPASSHILARYAPARSAPLIFSIKQAGVPIGSMVSGVAGPVLVVLVAWQGGLGVVALCAVVLALALQPLRREFDADRQPGRRLSGAEFKQTFMAVIRTPPIRDLAIVMVTFVGLQMVFVAFFVTYLVKGLGFSLGLAGSAFSIAMASAVFARVIWGWISARYASPRKVLAWLSVVMAAASVVTGLYGSDWPFIAIVAVAVVFASTAISWHGVLLAEVARLAPPDRVGAMTGGVISFGSASQMVYPVAFGAIIAFSGSYTIGFILAGLPALVAGLMLFRAPRAGPLVEGDRGGV